MDILTLIVIVIFLYIIYTLISTISSLTKEIKEMKMKCVKRVYKNDISMLDEPSTKDPLNTLKETFKQLRNFI
jgi:predicted Holliday junction resolvase-like endonuclease